jgi:transcriptional regulator GlxA family with amidase domain
VEVFSPESIGGQDYSLKRLVEFHMDDRIETALKSIERDIGRALRPPELAGEVRLSVSRFNDLFRQETGTVPARFIRACRYEKARQLLMTTGLSIKEIANQVGNT